MVMKARADITEDFNVELSWDSLLKEFILVKKSEGSAEGTVKSYRTIVGKFSAYCISQGFNSPDSVSKRVLRQYINGLSQSYTTSYVNNHISKIRVFYDFLCLEEYIEESADPSRRIKLLPKQQQAIVIYSDEEIAALIHEAGNQLNKFHAARDKLLLMIMADCGLRVNELVSLLDSNVTVDSIFVHNAKGGKQRMLYVTPAVAKQLIKYRRIRDAYFESKNVSLNGRLFLNFRGENMRNDGVQKMLKRIGSRVELRPTVRNSPHTFRHWFAQSQLNNGVSIFTLSKLLGHESISTTQLYLRGIADERLIKSAIETSPLMNLHK